MRHSGHDDHSGQAGQLTEVKQNGNAVATYTYDDNSNRLTHTLSGVPTNGTYDNQDRLLTYGGVTYTYTANGELQSKTVGGFDHDVPLRRAGEPVECGPAGWHADRVHH